MDLLAAGRDADVFLYDDGLVLRRYRDGRSAEPEAALMRELAARGYPVPVVERAEGADLVMELVDGETLADRMLGGGLSLAEAGAVLAGLLTDLHALPWPDGRPLLHLDLHPLNVIMGSQGPVVIDWSNARPGPAGLDVAMSALIVAQVAVTPGMLVEQPELRAVVAAQLTELLTAFAAAVSTPYVGHLADAEALRRRNPMLTAEELERLGDAVDLARSVAG